LAKNVGKFVDAIIKDNEDTLNNIVDFMATMIKIDWQCKVDEVLDNYYQDHLNGNRYKNKRTKSLYNDVTLPICNKIGSSYVTGVMFFPDLMSHSPLKQFNEEGIFENFMTGAHGNVPYTMPGTGEKIERKIHYTSPSAQSILDKYYNDYDKKIDEFWALGKALYN
jgi:hypothetical protein